MLTKLALPATARPTARKIGTCGAGHWWHSRRWSTRKVFIKVHLGIRQKLFASFGAVLCLLSVVGFIGYKNTSDFAADFQSLYNDRLVCIIQWDNTVQALYELRLEASTYPTA